ncbi:unnamed protein product [Mesocestoides corti]|uniref:ENTH domain-containing protein n=1 Tax=Mesocestoides corti TaxID=53468 RepID=A0A0R3U7P9_MESCO|nr:unnamed protein product [Mesocestoides corti]
MMPLQRHIKNVVRNYTEAERKVREATSNDPWGPSSTLMSQIADRTYNVIAFTEIMQMIWRRLNDKSKNWRHVYKALILLEYIIKTGSEKVAVQCRENIHAIETLMDFYYVEDGKDVGNSVREKARSLNALLRDEERLQEERAKALLARERLMHGGALGTTSHPSGSAYSPPSSLFARSASSVGDNRRPSSQPSLSGGVNSDLDSAQPQSYTEEQLQLQLALAISKEEHERELQKRHEEEAKEALKLQMVLEQSKREEQNRSAAASLISETNSTGGGTGGGLFNLIDTSLSAAPANVPDPWSSIVPVPVASPPPQNNHNPGRFTSPFDAPSNAPMTNQLCLPDTPWTPKEALQLQQSHTVPVANNNPWAALDPLDASSSINQNGNSQLACASTATATAAIPAASLADSNKPATARKRTPSDFLGDHKDLVDLEKLVDRSPASTNPFATGHSRTAAGHPTNPFSVNVSPKPSLNQLSASFNNATTTGGGGGAPLALLGSGRGSSAFSYPQRPITTSGPNPFPATVASSSSSSGAHQPPASQQSLNPFF